MRPRRSSSPAILGCITAWGCPNTPGPITVDDQFGSDTVTTSTTKMEVAPAPIVTTTTTTIPCGAEMEPCCAGNSCDMGRTCDIATGMCVLLGGGCGAVGEPCCPGNSCDTATGICDLATQICAPCGDPGE